MVIPSLLTDWSTTPAQHIYSSYVNFGTNRCSLIFSGDFTLQHLSKSVLHRLTFEDILLLFRLRIFEKEDEEKDNFNSFRPSILIHILPKSLTFIS